MALQSRTLQQPVSGAARVALHDQHRDAGLEQPEISQQGPRLDVAEWQERGGQRLTRSPADSRPGTDTSDIGNPAKRQPT